MQCGRICVRKQPPHACRHGREESLMIQAIGRSLHCLDDIHSVKGFSNMGAWACAVFLHLLTFSRYNHLFCDTIRLIKKAVSIMRGHEHML